MARISRFFPILWKTCAKLRVNPRANRVQIFVEIFPHIHPRVENSSFSQVFPIFPTNFPTVSPPLYLIKLFHYSTAPTTITTNIFNKERN